MSVIFKMQASALSWSSPVGIPKAKGEANFMKNEF